MKTDTLFLREKFYFGNGFPVERNGEKEWPGSPEWTQRMTGKNSPTGLSYEEGPAGKDKFDRKTIYWRRRRSPRI